MKLLDGNHRLDGYEFEQALGIGDGQGSLACCSSWDCKDLANDLEHEQWQQQGKDSGGFE